VPGKSTLNRLELSKLEPTRYHKISHNPVLRVRKPRAGEHGLRSIAMCGDVRTRD
jgi:hypothetical protein